MIIYERLKQYLSKLFEIKDDREVYGDTMLSKDCTMAFNIPGIKCECNNKLHEAISIRNAVGDAGVISTYEVDKLHYILDTVKKSVRTEDGTSVAVKFIMADDSPLIMQVYEVYDDQKVKKIMEIILSQYLIDEGE
jgi:hypothetical protein